MHKMKFQCEVEDFGEFENNLAGGTEDGITVELVGVEDQRSPEAFTLVTIGISFVVGTSASYLANYLWNTFGQKSHRIIIEEEIIEHSEEGIRRETRRRYHLND